MFASAISSVKPAFAASRYCNVNRYCMPARVIKNVCGAAISGISKAEAVIGRIQAHRRNCPSCSKWTTWRALTASGPDSGFPPFFQAQRDARTAVAWPFASEQSGLAAAPGDHQRMLTFRGGGDGQLTDQHISIRALTRDDIERLSGSLERPQLLIHPRGIARFHAGECVAWPEAAAHHHFSGPDIGMIGDRCALFDGMFSNGQRVLMHFFDHDIRNDLANGTAGANQHRLEGVVNEIHITTAPRRLRISCALIFCCACWMASAASCGSETPFTVIFSVWFIDTSEVAFARPGSASGSLARLSIR